MRTLVVLLLASVPVWADGPQDNIVEKVRPVPPMGTPLKTEDHEAIRDGLTELAKELKQARAELAGNPVLLDLLPDVEIYHKAVSYGLWHNELYVLTDPKTMRVTRNDVPVAKTLLKTGLKRAQELRAGKPSWTMAKGLVVRGYRSKIDGSVQPYGLVIPQEYDYAGLTPHRLDFWWHGRYENNLELSFIAERERSPGQFTPAGAIVVHPFGRFSNANKFAGEIDTFEVLDHVKKHYRIDERRIVARGFSMGGAACWQYAVHYPTLWCAAAPGAGFSETPEFLNVFQNEKIEPTWYEKKLWRMYNATDSAVNLFNLPTVAYSGEIDRQKQAADVMAREMKKVGLELTHIIGPKTAHTYEKGAIVEINKQIDAIVEKGLPTHRGQFKFTTYTLRYNRCADLTILRLRKHWEPATVEMNLASTNIVLRTSNVSSFAYHFPTDALTKRILRIDDQTFEREARAGDQLIFSREANGKWVDGARLDTLAKTPGLQGPIDDAFLDRFVMVRPTRDPQHEKTGAWVNQEMSHAIQHWRKQFRGDAPVKNDTSITDDDIKNANLVLWGDPASNAVLAKILDKLPVKWTKDGVVLGDKTYDAATHVPVLIFPNPLNPTRYVVLNSGFTYREYDYLNNARQVPKLPDYAILDVTTPPNARFPGKVVRAGFFGEMWQLQPNDGQ